MMNMSTRVSLAVLASFAFASAYAQEQTSVAREPELTAESVIVVDQDSGAILYSKDADTPRFPASTTKIMTSLLLVEHTLPSDVIVAPKEVEKVTGSSLHLRSGEYISAGDLLYALLLRSANDGCVALAQHISGSTDQFVALMNKRAKELGCTSTHFANPHGLNDETHVTTARDLSIIARAALQAPLIATVAKTPVHVVKRSTDSPDTTLRNKNKYLQVDPTATGLKTGWTIPAGKCFVGSVDRNGFRIVTVILKSKDWVEDQTKLVDWTYKAFHRIGIPTSKVLALAPVENGAAESVGLSPKSPQHLILPLDSELDLQAVSVPRVVAPVTKGSYAGRGTFKDSMGNSYNIPLAFSHSVARKELSSSQMLWPVGLVVGLVTVIARAWRPKRRRGNTNR